MGNILVAPYKRRIFFTTLSWRSKITYRDDKGDMNERHKHKASRGIRGHASPGNFLGFWIIQTRCWSDPFSSDKALQIGGLFHLSISTASNFIALIPSRLIRQMLANYFGVEFYRTVSKFRSRSWRGLAQFHWQRRIRLLLLYRLCLILSPSSLQFKLQLQLPIV